jgi:hypothetical protein
MKCSYGRAVQWKDGDAELTGVLVMFGVVLITKHGIQMAGCVLESVPVLVAHSYTRELEFIEYGRLSPYPASPISEPINTGASK